MTDNTPWAQTLQRPLKRIRQEILWVGIVTLLLCLTAGPCWSSHSEGAHPSPAPQASVSAHGSTIHVHHPASNTVPLLYELYWIGAIFMVVLLIFYFLYLYKKEKHWLVKISTFLLLFLALSLYLMEQGRIFAGYFDPVRHLFVPGYHEANDIGFLRFIYKLTLGIALCAYGFMNFLARQKNKKSINSGMEPKG